MMTVLVPTAERPTVKLYSRSKIGGQGRVSIPYITLAFHDDPASMYITKCVPFIGFIFPLHLWFMRNALEATKDKKIFM